MSLSLSGVYAQNLDWVKQMGGTSNASGFSIQLDAAGNQYIAGSFSETADMDPGAGTFNLTATGTTDFFVLKLDAAGDFVWAFRVGGTSYAEVYDLVLDGSGNIYLTGYANTTVDFDPSAATANLSSSNYFAFVAKYDSDGNYIWAKHFTSGGGVVGRGIDVDGAGNVYSTGYWLEFGDFDPGPGTAILYGSSPNSDAYVSKLDASGDFVWVQPLHSVSSGSSIGADIDYDDISGNVTIVGSFNGVTDFDPSGAIENLTPVGGYDGFICQLTADGDYNWAERFGGAGPDNANKIIVGNVASTSDIYVIGTFNSVADLDPTLGGTLSVTSAGGNDCAIIKLDGDGDFQFAKAIGGSGSDVPTDVVIDDAENIFVSGYHQETADFDPGAGTYDLTSAGGNDIFALKLDDVGDLDYAVNVGGSGGDLSRGIATLNGDAYLTGSFSGTADFDPGSGTLNLTSGGGSDAFVLKLTCNTTATINPSSCESYTVPSGDETYTSSGTYMDTLASANGCDSLITINLTINSPTSGSETATACDEYTWSTDGSTYTTSGTYTSTLINSVGCDSIVTLNLTINNSVTITNDLIACDSALINGTTYYTSQTLTEFYPAATVDGCDSTVITELTIPIINTATTLTGITITSDETEADSYQWLDCSTMAEITGETSSSYTATANGDYAVIVTIDDCSDTSVCQTISNVGMDPSVDQSLARLYPNPTSGKFSVEMMGKTEAVLLTIRSVDGRIIRQHSFNELQPILLDVTDQEVGVYLIEIQSGKQHAVFRLIKE